MKQKPRSIAAAVRAFCALTGKSLRSGQRHRSNGSPQWKQFLAGDTSAANDATPPDATPQDQAGEPAKMERASFKMWQAANQAYERLARDKADVLTLGAVALTVSRLRADHERAANVLRAAQIANREWIAWSEWSETFAALGDVFALLKSAPDEIALHANPASPATARNAIQRFLSERFESQARAILEKVIASPFPTA